MNDWKLDFYAKYSTHFGRKISAESYKVFEPYGHYLIRKCIPSDRSISVLDLGCGIGGFIKVLVEEGYSQVEGVDISAESVGYAHQHGLTKVREGNIFDTVQQSFDAKYDIVLLLDVLEHFTRPEVLNIIAEVYRILKPGGAVIIHVPNAEGLFGSRIRYSDITHEQAYTSNSLEQISRYAGFVSFSCFEDKPVVHGFLSLLRRVIWEIGTVGFRLLYAAETGQFNAKLSQNILFKAVRI